MSATIRMTPIAAARGIDIQAVSSTLEGDLDLRGFLGLSDDVPKGYRGIRVRFCVRTSTSADVLRECLSFSPVYEMMSNAVPVSVEIEIE